MNDISARYDPEHPRTTTEADAATDTRTDEREEHQQILLRKNKSKDSKGVYTGIPANDGPASTTSLKAEPDKIDDQTRQPLRRFAVARIWQSEFLALFVALFSFGFTVVVLKCYDGKKQPGFANTISINTLVAICSTILRATILFIISEGMTVFRTKGL